MGTAEPLRPARGVVLLTALLAGCSGTVSWQEVSQKEVPVQLAWRNAKELWGFGGKTVMRRVEGRWEKVELCAPFEKSDLFSDGRQAVTVAFEGDAVWALCGSDVISDGQVLLRHDGKGSAGVVELPFDGTLMLVPMVQGPPALLGARSMWAYAEGAWTSRGAHPGASKGEVISAAGLSLDEVYVVSRSTTATSLAWWNGSRWQAMLGGTTHPLELRFGKVWAGVSSLEAGLVTPLAFKGEAALVARQLTLSNLIAPDRALAVGGANEAYYVIGTQDDAPQALGTSPLSRSATPGDVTVYDVYGNSSVILSRGNDGSGVSMVYGVDANTVLIVYTTGGGFGGGASASGELIEGHR